ncbi:MAG: hypothetical protein WDA53_04620 [Bacillota bacterium]
MAQNNETPLLQTYWLPENQNEESSAFILAWLLFGTVFLFILLLTASFS